MQIKRHNWWSVRKMKYIFCSQFLPVNPAGHLQWYLLNQSPYGTFIVRRRWVDIPPFRQRLGQQECGPGEALGYIGSQYKWLSALPPRTSPKVKGEISCSLRVLLKRNVVCDCGWCSDNLSKSYHQITSDVISYLRRDVVVDCFLDQIRLLQLHLGPEKPMLLKLVCGYHSDYSISSILRSS